MSLQPDDEVFLYCNGAIPGNRWLEGKPGSDSVDLAPSSGGGFSGTRWKVHDATGGAIGLECLDASAGTHWLEGRPGTGDVRLAASLGGPLKGTRWLSHDATDGSVTVECLDPAAGPKWLDGRTINGTMGLAPATTPPFTGTRWSVVSTKNNWLPDYLPYLPAQVRGRYLFFIVTKDMFAGLDPTPDFLAAADALLADNGKSLKDNDYRRMKGLYETRVLGGWYNTTTRTYGYASMQVQPATATATHLAVSFFFNDNVAAGHIGPGWVISHWNDAGTDLFVHFAAAKDGNDPILGVSIQTTDPSTPADRYDGLSPSQRS